ncbi:MAG TPA: MBL fold metallo-hydrolase [Desulfobaccales bacterium]|nr:MBL fold metallo-hydrolase [Desulfobaccales bacterium]
MDHLFLLFCLAWARAGDRPSPRKSCGWPAQRRSRDFHNRHLDSRSRVLDLWRWQLGFGPQEEPALPRGMVPPYQAAIITPDLVQLNRPDPAKIQVTWVGHSTFLIQMAGVNILTDPIWSERASPVTFAGPKRHAPPGLKWQNLPTIDAVVISHNHYDHLDLATVKRLGNQSGFFVPLGLARWFNEAGLSNVVELDWGESAGLGSIKLHSVPAQHFSSRGLFDRDVSLWSSWVLEGPSGRVFFSCDTGYSPDFKEIGERFSPVRLSLLPIGGYQPRWFMRPMHVDPPEAVKIHQDLRSRQSIGMHWGTFKLTDEPLGEPPLYLARSLAEASLAPESFLVLKIGETRAFQ